MLQKFYSKLSEKEKKIFYIAFAFVVLALFDILFLRPVTSKLKNIDMEIFERENDLKRDLRLLSYRDRILKEKEAFSSYYTGEVKSPDQAKAEFLQKVEMLATAAKVNLNKIAPSEEKEKRGYIAYYADLDCTGALEDIVRFMHTIDATQELLKVVKVTINGGKPGAKEVSVSMTVVKIILDPKSVMSNKELGQHKGQGASSLPGSGAAGPSGGGTGPGGASGTDSAGKPLGEQTNASQPVGSTGAGTGTGGGAATGGAGGAGNVAPGSKAGGPGGSAGAGGSGGGAGSGGPGKAGKSSPGDDQEEAEEKKSKVPVTGERVQVQGIEALWNNFWGIKPKEPVDAPPENTEEPEEKKPNLWQKLLTESAPKETSEPAEAPAAEE
ncbi:MAG: hypothetical protein A2787_01940 [Omnitrophica WOR_2 bacterium RIFCSPHIGHO2_01_FULL_48_9]|nr:MAG: hypothetical protein A3D10_06775 [Omnitrophica WOR_2 bacterium RIFCSPHIGHO2_02_FULL_48_11]OGX34481.1 MAG: hypothetical protein A2787_01940 [Omnitrophica WOR_2 bacterium RIFCSPHIGHO2_01_FULL_48_9]